MPTALESLLEPFSRTRFRDEHYGRKHLLVRGRPDKFAGLFTWDDLNRLLNATTFPNKQIFTSSYKAKTVDSFAKMLQDCRDGASMIVNRIHELDPKIGDMTRALEAETGEPMNVNMYLSQPTKAAFPRHFDRHDVFVMQLYGKKAWCVCESTLEKPIFEMAEDSTVAPKEALLECELQPGDLLYIPRGQWHNALAQGGLSMHLTLGINARTGIHYLQWVTDQLRSDVRFRDGLPLSFTDEPANVREERLRKHLAKLGKVVASHFADPNTVPAFEKHRVLADRDFPRFKLPAQLLENPASELGIRRFSREPFQRFVIEENEDQELVELNVWGHLFQFPTAARPLIDFIVARTDFTFDDAMNHRGELTEAGVWEVLDPLLREGILDAGDDH